jgi:hypothetical protein
MSIECPFYKLTKQGNEMNLESKLSEIAKRESEFEFETLTVEEIELVSEPENESFWNNFQV